jgi:hypothetical protein
MTAHVRDDGIVRHVDKHHHDRDVVDDFIVHKL